MNFNILQKHIALFVKVLQNISKKKHFRIYIYIYIYIYIIITLYYNIIENII